MSNMRKFFQFIAFIVCLTMMLSILTACSSGESTQNENVVTFTDALGREVTVSKEPQQVATLIGSFADAQSGGFLFICMMHFGRAQRPSPT